MQVYYEVGTGWMYRLKKNIRGPYRDAKEAAKEGKLEAFFLRSIERAKVRAEMTHADKRAEGFYG